MTGGLVDHQSAVLAFDGQRPLLATHSAQPTQALAHWLPLAVLDTHNGSDIDESAATDRIALPTKVQGTAFDSTGALWLSTSDSRHGLLARSDPPGQAPTARHAMVIGMEGLAFDAQGALWSVSEAGSLRWQRWGVHFPVLFRIDPARLQD